MLPRLPSSRLLSQSRRGLSSSAGRYASNSLEEWVQKQARPISLRQLTFFGRTITEQRLLESANYVRTELPTRIAHRLRDFQLLPFVVVNNEHLSYVYSLYQDAFKKLKGVPQISSAEQNQEFCILVKDTLREHLVVIPRLATGILEIQDLMSPEKIDQFMNTLLKARISRRVIAEQHLALSDRFYSAPPVLSSHSDMESNTDIIGEVFLRCNAQGVVQSCWDRVISLARQAYGPECPLPTINIQGHLNATFPYILSHLQYIIGELLRNSIQAVVEMQPKSHQNKSTIEVLICDSPQNVIFRISDQGGGISTDLLPVLWSFCKQQRRSTYLKNLSQVPRMAATMQELKMQATMRTLPNKPGGNEPLFEASLSSLSARPPNLRLGMGLPMSRIYAEYWAGSLELHNLDGYGVDTFLQISKLGNKNEQLSTRASIDAV